MFKMTTKTYLIADSLETPLPIEFINSTNKKYIEIQNVNFYDMKRKYCPTDVFMHVNFIHERPYLDNLVVPVNTMQTKYKTYQFKGNEDSIQVWFTKSLPSVPTYTGEAELFDNTPYQQKPFDYKTAPDFEVIVDYANIFYEILTEEYYNNVLLSTESLYSADIQEFKSNLIGEHEFINYLREKADVTTTYQDLKILEAVYRCFSRHECNQNNIEALKFLIEHNNYWEDENIARIESDEFPYYGIMSINRIFDHGFDSNEFMGCDITFDDEHILIYSLYYHMIKIYPNLGRLFGFNQRDFNLFSSNGNFFNYLKDLYVPDDKIAGIKTMITKVNNGVNINGTISGYTKNFTELDPSIEQRFMFRQFCEMIIHGKEQKPNDWGDYNRRYDNNDLYVDEICSDSLTGVPLKREIKYSIDNTITYTDVTVAATWLSSHNVYHLYADGEILYNDEEEEEEVSEEIDSKIIDHFSVEEINNKYSDFCDYYENSIRHFASLTANDTLIDQIISIAVAIYRDEHFEAPEGYVKNFTCDDKDKEKVLMFDQICSILVEGKTQTDLVWTTDSVRTEGDETIRKETATDPLIDIPLTREVKFSLDGFDNEQTYFEGNEQKYNYRFFAEFMLIY